MSIYSDNGYSDREDYLNQLRDDYGARLVNQAIARFNPSQDFDELITHLENRYFENQQQPGNDDDDEDDLDDEDDDN